MFRNSGSLTRLALFNPAESSRIMGFILRPLGNLWHKYKLLTQDALDGTLGTEFSVALKPTIDLNRTGERSINLDKHFHLKMIIIFFPGAMAAAGACYGYVMHHWLQLLERFYPGRSLLACSRKLLCDSAFIVPLACALYHGTGILEGRSRETLEGIKKNFLDLILVNLQASVNVNVHAFWCHPWWPHSCDFFHR